MLRDQASTGAPPDTDALRKFAGACGARLSTEAPLATFEEYDTLMSLVSALMKNAAETGFSAVESSVVGAV